MNKNFLNNQNYILGNFERKKILTYFFSFKYVSIVFNKYFIFIFYTVFMFLFFGMKMNFLSFLLLYSILTIGYWMIGIGIGLVFALFGLNLLPFLFGMLFGVKKFFLNFFTDTFEIKPILFTYKNSFLIEDNFNFTINYIFYFILQSIFFIYIFSYVDIGINILNINEFVSFLIIILVFILFPFYNYFFTKKFYFKGNIRNLFFIPFIFLFGFLYNLLSLFRKKYFFIIKQSPKKIFFNGFDELGYNYAESKNYKIELKNNKNLNNN